MERKDGSGSRFAKRRGLLEEMDQLRPWRDTAFSIYQGPQKKTQAPAVPPMMALETVYFMEGVLLVVSTGFASGSIYGSTFALSTLLPSSQYGVLASCLRI